MDHDTLSRVCHTYAKMTTAGQWAHRVYWNDNRCSEQFTFLIQVAIPQAPCPLIQPLNTICEIKANRTVKSSEGTGCDRLERFNDAPWFPSATIGRPVPNTNYLSINQYASPDCDASGRFTYEQNTFAADGNCYAVETNESFFKATCSGSQGSLSICRDSACTQCTSLLNAGTFQQRSISFESNQCVPGGGVSLKMTCVTPSEIQRIQAGGSATVSPPTPTTTTRSSAMRYGPILLALVPFAFL
jgi:hypothetical protein